MAIARRVPFNPQSFLCEPGRGRTIESYKKGQIVFSQGDRADDVFFIMQGRVKVTIVSEQGKERILAINEPGHLFGHRCLSGQSRRIGTATAMTEAVIARIQKRALMQAIHQNTTFAGIFISHLVERFVRIEADLVDQLFNSSERRLARLLLLLSNGEAESGVAMARISQEILAEKIGTTRARVSVFMRKFQQLGLIDRKEGIQVHGSLLHQYLQDQLLNQHVKARKRPSVAAPCAIRGSRRVRPAYDLKESQHPDFGTPACSGDQSARSVAQCHCD